MNEQTFRAVLGLIVMGLGIAVAVMTTPEPLHHCFNYFTLCR